MSRPWLVCIVTRLSCHAAVLWPWLLCIVTRLSCHAAVSRCYVTLLYHGRSCCVLCHTAVSRYCVTAVAVVYCDTVVVSRCCVMAVAVVYCDTVVVSRCCVTLLCHDRPRLRRPPRERQTRCSIPAVSGSIQTSDFKTVTPVATLPGVLRYRISAGDWLAGCQYTVNG